jgi:hypothetical protein
VLLLVIDLQHVLPDDSLFVKLRCLRIVYPDSIDGVERPIDYSNPQGVMEFSLERGEHLVQLLFADTPVRLWSARLSLLTLFLLLCRAVALVLWPVPKRPVAQWLSHIIPK